MYLDSEMLRTGFKQVSTINNYILPDVPVKQHIKICEELILAAKENCFLVHALTLSGERNVQIIQWLL